ncbi:hypothetical protein AB4212_24660 [Streptomyces sp. 2MCAF27]
MEPVLQERQWAHGVVPEPPPLAPHTRLRPPPLRIVLDPFGGTGTTAAATKALGGVGISPAYAQLAALRSKSLPDIVRRRAIHR